MNPRYENYARVHGRTPDEQLAHDTEAWPGGKMAGFMIWMSERWQEWRKANGRKRDDLVTDEDHKSFDALLSSLPVLVCDREYAATEDTYGYCGQMVGHVGNCARA